MNQENIRVLIADDVPQVRQGLATMLKLASKNSLPEIIVVGEARDGKEAVEQVQLLQPDVVLMDLEMPVLDGYHATQCIKAQHPSIFIIVLTIHSNPTSRQEAARAGADMFIEKSSPLDGLVRAIQGIRQVNNKELI